jgi:hypothetical protein
MINILYLLKTLDTAKLSEFVAAIDAAPLDMNLAIWGAIDRGEIKIDEKKDKIRALKDAEPWCDEALALKIMAVANHYAINGTNITAGRLNSYVKDPTSGRGYPLHEYLMTVQYLIDTGALIEDVLSIPKTKNRPFNRWIFLGIPGNDNAEMNAKAVNKWIAQWESKRVK